MKKFIKWTGIVLAGLIGLTFLTGLALYPSGMQKLTQTYPGIAVETVKIPADADAVARRNELDRERNDRELEQADQSFWMICPKCGDLLEESEGENVKLERCENCGGLYLDRGEVDLILSLCVGPDAYRRLHNIMKF